jgi:predicted metal-dependent peptidase
METNTAEFALSRAKAQLVMEQPFYAALLCNMPFVEKKEIKGLEVDGKSIYYNAEYVNGLTVNQLKFIQANGVMKCVFQHVTRRGARDKKKWDKSSDLVINDMLVQDLVGDRHPDWAHDPHKVQQGEFTADGIYKIIMEEQEDDDGGQNGQGQGDGDGDSDGKPGCEIGDSNPSEASEVEEQWTIRAVQAAEAAKMQGKLSANIRRFIEDIIDPKVKWQEALQRFVSKQAKVERSFSRPNRRFVPQGLYLPAMSGEKLGRIAIAVDCSGSISTQILNEFAAEIKAIKALCRPEAIDVLYFDSEVSHIETYRHEDELDIKPHGGGGTAFSPVMRAIQEFDEQPEALIFLTDLCCNDFGPAPEYPVMWVTNDQEKAPWGEVVKM